MAQFYNLMYFENVQMRRNNHLVRQFRLPCYDSPPQDGPSTGGLDPLLIAVSLASSFGFTIGQVDFGMTKSLEFQVHRRR